MRSWISVSLGILRKDLFVILVYVEVFGNVFNLWLALGMVESVKGLIIERLICCVCFGFIE